jgi:hypothetical protein
MCVSNGGVDKKPCLHKHGESQLFESSAFEKIIKSLVATLKPAMAGQVLEFEYWDFHDFGIWDFFIFTV